MVIARSRVWATTVGLVVAGCVYSPIDLEGRGPPCAPGFVEADGASGRVCVRPQDASGADGWRDGAGADAHDPCADAPEPRCEGEEVVRCDGGEQRSRFACEGEELLACEGGVLVRAPCRACVETPVAHCAYLPVNVGDAIAWDAGEGDLVVPSGETWTIDTDTRTVDRGDGPEVLPAGVVATELAQVPGAPDLLVIAARAIRVELDATLRATGGTALVLLATGAIEVAGRVDVSASAGVGGAGSSIGCDASCGGDGDGAYYAFGGGGGGFGGAGGEGGDGPYCRMTDTCGCSRCFVPGAGGAARGTAELEPLLAGARGGLGFREAVQACPGVCPGTGAVARGGQGGGAVQLIAGAFLVVERTGTVAAHGEGGANGGLSGAAGGGGSGGAIVLEAPLVRVRGRVSAHGGAGGTGGPCDQDCCDGSTGCEPFAGLAQSGRDDASATAPVGTARGGAGGVAAVDEGAGSARKGGTGRSGGGGGGGAGRVRVSTCEAAPDLTSVSPAPSVLGLGPACP